MKKRVLLLMAIHLFLSQATVGAQGLPCTPTQPDMLGPFYEPGAPVRSKVGSGYVLTGTVKSTDCKPLPKASIEFWLAGPEGEYDDRYQGTLIADKKGSYRIETHQPVEYGGRPPHIHLRVTAKGHETLVTQHYPEAGKNGANVDLVLKPEK